MDSTKLSQKQIDLIKTIYRFRFLTSIQLQQLFTNIPQRTLNYNLKHLYSNNYINRHYSRSDKDTFNPAIYFLNTQSINVLKSLNPKDSGINKRVYNEKYRSQTFVSGQIELANYFLYLSQKVKDQKASLDYFTEIDLIGSTLFIKPYPHVYFKRVDSLGEESHFIFEYLHGDTTRAAIITLIQRLGRQFESERFQKKLQIQFPSILIMCETQRVKKRLNTELVKRNDSLQISTETIFMATKDEAYKGEWSPVVDKD